MRLVISAVNHRRRSTRELGSGNHPFMPFLVVFVGLDLGVVFILFPIFAPPATFTAGCSPLWLRPSGHYFASVIMMISRKPVAILQNGVYLIKRPRIKGVTIHSHVQAPHVGVF